MALNQENPYAAEGGMEPVLLNREVLDGPDGLTIQFENNLEDVIQYNLYLHKKRKFARKRMILFGFVVLMMGISMFSQFRSGVPDIRTIAMLLPLILVILAYPFLIKFGIKRNVKNVFQNGKNPGMRGIQTLTLNNDHIFRSNECMELKLKWNAVETVEKSGDYVYITYSTLGAHIIPSRHFESEEVFEKFHQTALGYFERNAA